jgi:hypothetical protein
MIGTGYWHKCYVKNHNHYQCWLDNIQSYAKDWYFKNDYKPTSMAPEIAAELNRLRARRYYVRKHGGKTDEETVRELEIIESKIKLVKSQK